MKRVLLLMFALICFGVTANAQSCKINGTDDGSTIMVTNAWKDGSTINVNLSNDSEKTCANVTVEVDVTYEGSNNIKTYKGYGKSCPNQDCKIEIPISDEIRGLKYRNYKVTSVSGNKCN